MSEVKINYSKLLRLNECANRTIEEKRESNIDFDFLEKVYEIILRNANYLQEGKVKCIIPIKKEDIIRITLDFFQSIDEEFYQRAKNVIMNIDEQASSRIVNVNIDDRYGRISFLKTMFGKSEAYMPIQSILSKQEALENETGTLEDLYSMVHEISHLFDLNFKDSLPKIVEPNNKKEKKITRNLFGESTTRAFEILLTEYLLKNTDYSRDAIKQQHKMSENDYYDMTSSTYIRLLLAREYKKNGKITQETLERLRKEKGLDIHYFRHITDKIIKDQSSLTFRNRYAVANAVAPTIVKKYHKNGSKILKMYLNAIKEDDLEKVLDILEISLSNEGIRQVLDNKLQLNRNIDKEIDEVER